MEFIPFINSVELHLKESQTIANMQRKLIAIVCCDALVIRVNFKCTIIDLVYIHFHLSWWYGGRSSRHTKKLMKDGNNWTMALWY